MSSLRTRLLVAVGILAVAAIVAVGLAARQGTRLEFRRFQELVDVGPGAPLHVPLAELAAQLDGRCCAEEVLHAAAATLPSGRGFLVLDADTRQVVATGGATAGVDRDLRVTATGDRIAIDGRRVQDGVAEDVSLVLRDGGAPRILLADGRRATVHVLPVRSADGRQPAAAFLGSIDRRLLIATTIIAAVVLLVTWELAGHVVEPIREMSVAARDVARGDLARRVDARGSDEIAALAHAFNAMASDLERQQELRRNLVHDVAHELRTPLTALRCRLESMIDGVAVDPTQALQGANQEVAHLKRLVDDLEDLALAEAGELRLAIATVSLEPIVRSATQAAGLEGDRRLRLDVDRGVTVHGDAVRLRQALLNLLTNADRHTPADGTITIRVARDADEAVVSVHNTGSTLDDQQLARAFDRFWRADPARQRETGGSGLGLAIVKHLIQAQRGRVWAKREADGVRFGFAVRSRDGVSGGPAFLGFR
jgi:signal transduction histidine kinase